MIDRISRITGILGSTEISGNSGRISQILGPISEENCPSGVSFYCAHRLPSICLPSSAISRAQSETQMSY